MFLNYFFIIFSTLFRNEMMKSKLFFFYFFSLFKMDDRYSPQPSTSEVKEVIVDSDEVRNIFNKFEKLI